LLKEKYAELMPSNCFLYHESVLYRVSNLDYCSMRPLLCFDGKPFGNMSQLAYIFSLIQAKRSFNVFYDCFEFWKFVTTTTFVVPHVTPWLFPSFFDLVIISFLKFIGKIAFVDDGTTGVLSSSLPRRFFACPRCDLIYSINYTWSTRHHKGLLGCNLYQYMESLRQIKLNFAGNVPCELLATNSILLISSKYFDLSLVNEHLSSVPSNQYIRKINYIPHPRAWKNDFGLLKRLFPAICVLRVSFLELFIDQNLSKFKVIYIGYSSTALVLAEMKLSGLLTANLVLIVSFSKIGKYGTKGEVSEFLRLCSESAAFSEIIAN
jgi:hypothetical protein